jgi:hypothetical protein
MIDNDGSAADRLGQIADEFVEAFRQGKRPSLEEFARRYPEHAHEIRDMLPALVLMEKAKSLDDDPGERGKAGQGKGSAAAPRLRSWGITVWERAEVESLTTELNADLRAGK